MLPKFGEHMKKRKSFWEDMDELITSFSDKDKIIIGADLNGHVGITLNELLDDLFPGFDHSGVTYKNGDIFSPTGYHCGMCQT